VLAIILLVAIPLMTASAVGGEKSTCNNNHSWIKVGERLINACTTRYYYDCSALVCSAAFYYDFISNSRHNTLIILTVPPRCAYCGQ